MAYKFVFTKTHKNCFISCRVQQFLNNRQTETIISATNELNKICYATATYSTTTLKTKKNSTDNQMKRNRNKNFSKNYIFGEKLNKQSFC